MTGLLAHIGATTLGFLRAMAIEVVKYVGRMGKPLGGPAASDPADPSAEQSGDPNPPTV